MCLYLFLFYRTIGKASSESRLYFSALEECNFSTISESHDAKLLSCCDSSFNIRASYLLGQHIYGNAILASIGYTWRGAELFNEDLSLRSYFRSFFLLKVIPIILCKTFVAFCSWHFVFYGQA